MPLFVIYVCAAMLFLGAAPMPYGYYTLLRLVCCIVFAYTAFLTAEKKYKFLPWIYGLLALLFNPIVKVHFPKELWAVVDIAAGVLLLVNAKKVRAS